MDDELSEVKGTKIPGHFKSNAAEFAVQKVLDRHKKQQKVNDSMTQKTEKKVNKHEFMCRTT